MFSKSIPERSAPQFGIGRARKYSRALRRDFRIQSGSFLWAEISETTSGVSPRFDLKT